MVVTIEKKGQDCYLCYLEGNKFFKFNDIEEFILFITNKKNKKKWKIYYVNNLTEFTLLILKDEKKAWNIEIKSFLSKGEVYSLDLKDSLLNVHCFKCSKRFFTFGIEETFELKIKNEWEKIIEIKKSWENLNKLLNAFDKKWLFKTSSLSGGSLLIFKNHFNRFLITVNKNPIKNDEIFRKGFRGARVEVFGNKIESEKIFYYDFPSMYGNIMKEEFPYGNWTEKEDIKDIGLDGLYLVEVESEKIYAPVLPTITTKDPSQIFANGTFEDWYYKDELDLFLEKNGKIKKIKKGFVFEKKGKVFYDFSTTMLNLRDKNNFNKKLCKSLIVSLYGRMGMSPEKNETKIVRNENEYKEIERAYEIKSETWINEKFCILEYKTEGKKIEQVNSNVMYAGYITAKARVRLYRAMEEVRNNNGRVLYVDTDCIFAAFKKKNKIKQKNFKIIKWNETRIENAVFASGKMYSLAYKKKWETKICGVPTNSISFEEFYKMFYGLTEDGKKVTVELKKVSPHQFYSKNIEKFININTYNKREFIMGKKETKAFRILDNMIIKDLIEI